eukprot:352497-Chlamydomonas_euryale.AAC.3
MAHRRQHVGDGGNGGVSELRGAHPAHVLQALDTSAVVASLDAVELIQHTSCMYTQRGLNPKPETRNPKPEVEVRGGRAR